jgi:DNA-binding response OmpR family regulator
MHAVRSEHMHVLVIEDDETINETLCALLRDEGYQATCVTTLAAAQTFLAECEPACVLMDLHLPDGSTERLLTDLSKRGCAPRSILMSASQVASRVAGRFGIPLVLKPFDVDIVLAAIRSVIERDHRPVDADDC